ncbi:MtrAB system histidine kinase MtrB [Leifsonia sp. YIM 134122]|uniref:Sensor histidine kinase MtrB n=1 Tax=Leifsonia stereocauli TaxID=3134136 RepID=A0ABU9W3E8_9MICO
MTAPAAEPRLLGVDWASWRTWPTRTVRLWRSSLQFRTTVITLGLSGLAILLAGVYLSVSVSNNLFQSRLELVLSDSSRATESAQRILDASDASDRDAVQAVLSEAQASISAASSSRLIAMSRAPGQPPSTDAPLDFTTNELRGTVISTDLRRQVQSDRAGQFWQSVTLTDVDDRAQPGIVVGSQLLLPKAGWYEVYIGYSLADVQQTLSSVQQTAAVAALALLLLIAAVTWVVVRLVVTPIRVAAETSEQLAAGDLEVRIPEKGEDVIATLARSFNGMADSLQLQIKELADLSEVQQRFVSDVSHELRTPLTTIRLAGDVLYDQRDSFTPVAERTVELLHTQVERFEVLLADLLEISRYDAGSVDLAREPTNLAHLAADAVASMHTLAERNGCELQLVAPGGHVDVLVDPRRIRRILRNLLGNAIEHGEHRPIIVSVDSNATAVAIGVRDYGIGMTAEAADHVFDRFWRADPSRQRTIGGTGLGLAIALEDAVVHGGAIEVWSQPDAGSNFLIVLPRTADSPRGDSPLALVPEDAGATEPAAPVSPVDGPASAQLIGGADA